jgi:hypothetical protein
MMPACAECCCAECLCSLPAHASAEQAGGLETGCHSACLLPCLMRSEGTGMKLLLLQAPCWCPLWSITPARDHHYDSSLPKAVTRKRCSMDMNPQSQRAL